MISDNADRVSCTSQILAPLFKCPYDSEKLSVIDIVVSLCWSEGLGIIGAGVQIPIAIFLHQHRPRGNKRSVGHDEEGKIGIGVTEDWLFQESLLKFQKGGFAVRKPLPSGVLLCQGEEGLDDVGEVRDEFSIKVAEAHERVYCTNRGRRPLFVDGHQFNRVHRDLTFTNDQPKVFCLGCAKDTFLQFYAELMLAQMLKKKSNM